MVILKLNELKSVLPELSQIGVMHRVDSVLFSHEGLSREYVKWLDKSLLEADIDDVIAEVNNLDADFLWNNESPLWLRPQFEHRKAFRKDCYKQVVGHTPVEMIYEKDGFISTDVFSTYQDGRQIGESAMIVIDSVTGEYEKLNVPGKPGDTALGILAF